MTKRSRPTKHYPGELERLTLLIEQKAKEIAEVLLWDVPDAEQRNENRKSTGRVPKRKPGDPRTAALKPKKGQKRWSKKTAWPSA